MKHTSKLLCGLVTLSLVIGHNVVGFAAENQKAEKNVSVAATEDKQSDAQTEKKQEQQKVPMIIEGDDISFDDKTGNVYAKGTIVVTQADTKLSSDEMHGNTRSADVWSSGNVHYVQPEAETLQGKREYVNLKANDSFYNYQKQEGMMEQFDGQFEKKYIKGERLEFSPEEIIVYNGRITKCPAKKPDYYVKAKKIIIWPDDKLIAYNAEFYLKDIFLYSKKKYVTQIGKNAEKSDFPRIGYNSHDGFYVRQALSNPISDKFSTTGELGYFSKHGGFKGNFGVVNNNSNFDMTLASGYYEDDDDNWIRKEADLKFLTKPKKIADTHFNYNFMTSIGNWYGNGIRSWHQEASVYFKRDPIMLDKSLALHLGTGYNIVKESYDDSQINTMKYDATFVKTFSPKFTAATGYYYTKKSDQNVLFKYDTPDVSNNWGSSLSYRPDSKNTFVVVQSYDVKNKQTADLDYYWYHDLHCITMQVQYREKRQEWRVHFEVKEW